MKARPILFSGPMVRALLDGRKTQTRRVVSPENIRFWTGGFDYAGRHSKPDKELFEYAMREAAEFRFHDGVLAWTGAAFDYQAPATRTNWMGRCAYGQPGDLLWVRETWAMASRATDLTKIYYKAHESASHTDFHELIPTAKVGSHQPTWPRFKPSIHMPRWASRLTLELTGVRVERLCDISEADARAEGCKAGWLGDARPETPLGDGWSISSPGTYASAAGNYQILWDSINGEGAWDADPWVWVLEFKVHRCNVDELLEARVA